MKLIKSCSYLVENVGNNFKESRTGVVVIMVTHGHEIVQTGLNIGAKKVAEGFNGVFSELCG